MSEISIAERNAYRLLKRTAIVLLLMLRLDRPAGEKEIARILDIDQETARKYLRSLADIGLVARTRYHEGWILTRGGRQMVLGEPVESADSGGANAEIPRFETEDSSSTTALTNLNLIKSLSTVVVVEGANAGIPRFEIDPEIQAAFEEVGIAINKRTIALAQQSHVTPAYIRDHASALRERKGGNNHTGLLITILESGQPAPEIRPEPGSEEDRLRYLAWTFCDECDAPWNADLRDYDHYEDCPNYHGEETT